MRLICVCGRVIELPSANPGRKIHCPKCHAKLYIPSSKEDHDLIRWFCPCGQRLKARIKSAGRTIKCPTCHKSTTVPFVSKDDDFIDTRFVIPDTDTPTHPQAANAVEEPSLRQERNEEFGIVEAEIMDELEPDTPDPKPSPVFDFEEESLELAPLPHEEPAPPAAQVADEPISLAGFEIEGETGDMNEGSELAPPSP